jgi:hypothetical protein
LQVHIRYQATIHIGMSGSKSNQKVSALSNAVGATVNRCNEDSIVVSFVPLNKEDSSPNLDQLEPTFMYTKILKEILLAMEYDAKSVNDFITFCRSRNCESQSSIDLFEKDYHSEQAICWYTRSSFIYFMLNGALRILEADTIINMGFFLRDLHHRIEQLHQQQISSYNGKSFTVYRGQGLSKEHFEKLRKTKGGLISFNNFLSTSKEQTVSFVFAEGFSSDPDMVGILFKMSIDPSVSLTAFASIREASSFPNEEEILLSMHTVFRIGAIKQIDSNSRLYQVELQLTADDDEQLRILTKFIGEESADDTGWKRFGFLLVKIGQLQKAEQLFQVLLQQTSDEGEKWLYYNQLGCVKYYQGDYEKAICYYEKGFAVSKKALLLNHPSVAVS